MEVYLIVQESVNLWKATPNVSWLIMNFQSEVFMWTNLQNNLSG